MLDPNNIRQDALEYMKALPSKVVDCIITDPPYDLDQSTKAELHKEFLRICSGDILVFSPPENQWVFDDVKYLFWVKPTSTKNYSRSYGRFVEMVFLYQRGYTWNTNLRWANYTGVFTDIVIGKSNHPHEKPYSLIERLVRIHTLPGHTILDPFAGSGTVINVATSLDRHAIGIDHDYPNS